MSNAGGLSVAPSEEGELAHVEALTAQGAGGLVELVELLGASNWVVRRAAVAALAKGGDDAVPLLCEQLSVHRESEARIAAAVDALSASVGNADAAVLRLTEHADPAVVYDGAQVLGRRRSAAGVGRLAQLTRHDDDNVAVAAIEALGRIGGSEALDALIMSATSQNFFRTFPAIDVLGRSGDARALPPLLGLLTNPIYAGEAARALGRIGREAAAPHLLNILGGAGQSLARITAVALAEIHERQRAEGFEELIPAMVAALQRPGSLARRLGQAIPGADVPERVALCRILGWLGGDDAVQALVEQLDGDATVAKTAVAALAAMGERAAPHLLMALRLGQSARRLILLPNLTHRKAAVADVTECLADPDPAVRAEAADTLARIGDPSAVPRLFELLAEADPRVAKSALAAIQSLGSKETEARALTASQSDDLRLRRAALRIVSYFGYPRALDVLLDNARHEDDSIREAALQGLGVLEEPRALEALVAAGKAESARTRGFAFRAMAHTRGEKAVREALRAGLRDPEPWPRYYACQALGRLGVEEASAEVVALMDDPAGQVAVAAVEALAQLPGPQSLAALRDAASSANLDIRRAALIGLGLKQEPSVLPVLLQGLASPDTSTRLVVLSALSGFESPEALQTLVQAATDEDASVRGAAISHLGAMPATAATRALVGLLDQDTLRSAVLEVLASPSPGRVAGIHAALETVHSEALKKRLAEILLRLGAGEPLPR